MAFVSRASHSQDKRLKHDKILCVVHLQTLVSEQHETLTALRQKETAEKMKVGWNFIQCPLKRVHQTSVHPTKPPCLYTDINHYKSIQ